MRMLVLAAHPDDEVLGAGATIAKFAALGHRIKVVSFTDGVGAREESSRGRQHALSTAGSLLGVERVEWHTFPDNRMDSVPLLDVIKVVEKSVSEWEPTHILTHTGKCLNVDHRRVFEATLVAVRGMRSKVMCYEVLSSTEWNHGSPPFCPNTFVDVTGFEETKISAMREAYGEELRGEFHPRSLDTIRQQMRVNGSVCNVAYAERFETIKEVL